MQAHGARRGHGEDSIYWDASRNRYIGAVDTGFSPAGKRIRKMVSGKTKAEVRDKLKELYRAAEADGLFCYTFFKGIATAPLPGT